MMGTPSNLGNGMVRAMPTLVPTHSSPRPASSAVTLTPPDALMLELLVCVLLLLLAQSPCEQLTHPAHPAQPVQPAPVVTLTTLDAIFISCKSKESLRWQAIWHKWQEKCYNESYFITKSRRIKTVIDLQVFEGFCMIQANCTGS